MRSSLALALVGLLVPAASARADVRCPTWTRSFFPINDGLPITLDGGIVIGEDYRLGADDQPAATYVFKTTTGPQKPSVTVLAPGLVRYGVPAGVAEADLMNGDAEVAHAKLDRTPGPLAEPLVTEARLHVTERNGDRVTSLAVSVDATSTKGVALILLDAKGEKPLAYTKSTAMFTLAARCRKVPAGTTAVKVGDSVTVRWVDAWGRLSPISRPIKVVQGRRK